MKTIRQANIKDRNNIFFNGMTNIKNIGLSLLDIDLITFESNEITIYDVKYIKDLNSLNSLYLVFNNLEAYVEENDENKYLVLASTHSNGDLIEKDTEIWNEIKKQVNSVIDDKVTKYVNMVKILWRLSSNQIMTCH